MALTTEELAGLDPDVFRRAISTLEEKGWTRGTEYDEESGCYCAVGAVCAGLGMVPTSFISTTGNLRKFLGDGKTVIGPVGTNWRAEREVKDRLGYEFYHVALNDIIRERWYREELGIWDVVDLNDHPKIGSKEAVIDVMQEAITRIVGAQQALDTTKESND